MKYFESYTTELKREVTDEIKKEIIAFLNSFGGTIYVGVDDDGNVFWSLNEKARDIEKTKIINWLSCDIIMPNPRDFINMFFNEDGVLVIEVAEGNKKPYYLKEEGLTPKGVYLRYDTSKFQASTNEIADLALKSKLIHFEDLNSLRQDLSFKYLESKSLNFSKFTHNFINNDFYSNLAYIFSDNYVNITKIYFVDDNNKIIKKLKFKGSILEQIDKLKLFFKSFIEDSYKFKVIEEAILNSFIHRDYSVRDNIRIEITKYKINFISPGGIYNFTEGSGLRNPKIKKVLKDLGYTNTYKTSGIKEIFNESRKVNVEPIIITTSKQFILSIPKKNKRNTNN